jgi:hypothetical protein
MIYNTREREAEEGKRTPTTASAVKRIRENVKLSYESRIVRKAPS